MKLKKLLFSAAAVVCMCVCLCTSVFAADLDDTRFKDKTWDQVIEEFLAAHNVEPEQVTIGYYNTVTGEEHYLNKDTLMYGASMAKLPTNMLYAERISKGEMTMETKVGGTPYHFLLRASLVNSDNPAMDTMVRDLGGGNYSEFRKKILPYIGVELEDATPEFLARNFFTPEQILYCLKLLYGNADRFPGVEYQITMASPYDYFKQNQPPYTIAHKYGWYTDNGTTYLNDSAIVYTHDPILIVMFTANVKEARQLLADYCSLMCDYAQYHRTLRYTEQASEHTGFSVPTDLEFLSAEAADSVVSSELPQWQYIVVGVGGVLFLIAFIVLFRKFFLGFFLLLIALATIAVGCAPTALAYYAEQENTAKQIINSFSEAFHTESRGMEYLTHCDTAMAHTDRSDSDAIIVQNISDSFSLKFNSAKRVGNYLEVSATATKVDLDAVSAALNDSLKSDLKTVVKDLDLIVLFDKEGNFLPETMNTVLQNSFDTAMEGWNDCLRTEDVTLHLSLDIEESIMAMQPVWKIITDDALLSAVNY